MPQITKITSTDVAELLESENLQAYLHTMATFHNYSWRNSLLIFKQMPHATKLASFDQWQHWGRHVKKGARAVKIFAPTKSQAQKKLTHKSTSSTGDSTIDSKIVFEEIELPTTSYKLTSVFDISQTAGNSIEMTTYDVMASTTHTNAFVITLKSMTKSENVHEDVATATVNVVHEMLCDIITPIELAIVTFIVCQRFNLGSDIVTLDNVFDWGTKDIAGFMNSLTTIRNEASNIITALEDSYRLVCEEHEIDITILVDESNPKPHIVAKPTPATDPNDDITDSVPPAKYDKCEATHTTPAEPSFHVHTRIESMSDVDFTYYDVTRAITSEEGVASLPEYQPIAITHPEIPKVEIPVYLSSAEIASEYGQTEEYYHSLLLNMECAETIDQAIQKNKNGNKYNLIAVARNARNTYGLQRVQVVVAATIVNNIDNFNADIAVWATAITLPPDIDEFQLTTHLNIVQVLTVRLREIENEKLPFKKRLTDAELLSKSMYG